jgi:glycosyltransferase involved in cell wall biosynthesis
MVVKKKILMLCDHPLSTSGVGTQARWLIHGLLATGKYSFRVFGGAVKHADYNTVVVNPDFIVKPTDGFGNRDMLRHALATEKPDVLLLFTDPRFFIWVWEMEDEVHQICPIAYNHLWDNPPWPEFNRVLYESTDLINCINYPTFEMVSKQFPTKTNYIPHAVPVDNFKKLPDNVIKDLKRSIIGKEREEHFVALFVSRNARRKMPSDIIVSFKQFLVELEKKHGHRNASLVMHTDPLDPEGPNLIHVIDMLHMNDHVIFSKDRIGFQEMNNLYNIADVVINRSCNEGFGLSALEAKMAEKPIIALKTGGLTRQVEDHVTGFQYGVALPVETRSLVGNQMVPYIYEDFVSHETTAQAFMQMYEIGPEKRAEIGKRSREHAMRDYNMEFLIKSWDESLTNLTNETKSSWRHVEL